MKKSITMESGLGLKEFVTASLTDIVSGIVDAQRVPSYRRPHCAEQD
jgi:hypothetical protein